MYGKDLSQKTFLENVYDDVVKTFFKHFASYIKKNVLLTLLQLAQVWPTMLVTLLLIHITMINLLFNG